MKRALIAAMMGLPLASGSAHSQEPSQHQHHAMGPIPVVKAEFPRMGKSQEHPQTPLIQVSELEELALERNPTLAQAEAEIRTATAVQQQSGLYPNPRVGYTGEEIHGGELGGGQHGFFISQTFVTAGKLGLNRQVAGQNLRISELEAEEQRLRVMNAVKLAYYRMLAAQEMLDIERDLLRIAEDRSRTHRELRNVGQVDDPELLQIEVEQQHQEMAVAIRENGLRQAWRALTAVLGAPELPLHTVAGNLEEDPPELEESQAIETLARESPAVRIAEAVVERTRAVFERQRKEPIPDIEVRGGLQRNGEIVAMTGAPIGLQGFAEVGVEIPLFDRNQGNVAASRAQMERAEREVARVRLLLRERGAGFFESYESFRIMVERYRTQLLPLATRAYELMVQNYGLMLASYPQVLESQETLFRLQSEYVSALEGRWMNQIALAGLLLVDGLEAPARPSDVDMPVREINMPSARRGMGMND